MSPAELTRVFMRLTAWPGRLWHTNEPEDQEVILTAQLYKLIYTLAKYDVPLTLLLFPVFVNDPEYLYRKIKFVLDDINYQNDAEDHGREPVGIYDIFFKAFQRISRPELVHDFTRQENKTDYFRKPKTWSQKT
jgi:hypothetical protein